MDNLNCDFLEQYKRLDHLCLDIYKAEKGLSSYIDDMRGQSAAGRRSVPDWETDLNHLVRLRHARNQLAHEIGTWDKAMCTQSDIDWLNVFRQRILNRSDPIALLERRRREVLQATYRYRNAELQAGSQANKQPRSGKQSTSPAFWVLLIGLVAVCLRLLLKFM